MMRYLCKADTYYGDSKEIFFLLELNQSLAKRLLELMDFFRSLEKTYPEIISVDAVAGCMGYFLESPELIRKLKKTSGRKSIETNLDYSWIEIPDKFEIKVGYDNLPLGVLDTVGNGITVDGDGLYIQDNHKGTLAKLVSRKLEYDFVKQFV